MLWDISLFLFYVFYGVLKLVTGTFDEFGGECCWGINRVMDAWDIWIVLDFADVFLGSADLLCGWPRKSFGPDLISLCPFGISLLWGTCVRLIKRGTDASKSVISFTRALQVSLAVPSCSRQPQHLSGHDYYPNRTPQNSWRTRQDTRRVRPKRQCEQSKE